MPTQAGEHVEAGKARHHDVEQQQVEAGPRRGDQAQCVLTVGGAEHLVPGVHELVFDHLAHVGIVVGNEYETHDSPRPPGFGRAGNLIVNVLPRP